MSVKSCRPGKSKKMFEKSENKSDFLMTSSVLGWINPIDLIGLDCFCDPYTPLISYYVGLVLTIDEY